LLSFSYIVKNEAHNIVKSLNSVKDIASEIVIVDTGSTDNTVNVINKWYDDLGIINKPVLKLLFKEWTDYADCKNFAVSHCTNDWIFNIDGDEWLQKPEGIKKLIDFSRENDIDCWFCIQLDQKGQMTNIVRLFKQGMKFAYDKEEDKTHENIDTTGKRVGYSTLVINHNRETDPVEHAKKVQNIMKFFEGVSEGNKKDYYEGLHCLYVGKHKEAFEKLNRVIDKLSYPLRSFTYQAVSSYYNSLARIYETEAFKFINKSLEYAPNQNQGYLHLADYYLHKGDKDNALKSLQFLRDRDNKLITDMQNDHFYTNEEIDSKIKQVIGV